MSSTSSTPCIRSSPPPRRRTRPEGPSEVQEHAHVGDQVAHAHQSQPGDAPVDPRVADAGAHPQPVVDAHRHAAAAREAGGQVGEAALGGIFPGREQGRAVDHALVQLHPSHREPRGQPRRHRPAPTPYGPHVHVGRHPGAVPGAPVGRAVEAVLPEAHHCPPAVDVAGGDVDREGRGASHVAALARPPAEAPHRHRLAPAHVHREGRELGPGRPGRPQGEDRPRQDGGDAGSTPAVAGQRGRRHGGASGREEGGGEACANGTKAPAPCHGRPPDRPVRGAARCARRLRARLFRRPALLLPAA